MPKPKQPKRNLHAIDQETTTPPATLAATQQIARVHSAAGNNLYRIELPSSSSTSTNTTTADPPSSTSSSSSTLLAELPLRFRHTIWIKRGMYVVVDTAALAARENKLGGEIVNIVREEKAWRKMPYWPEEFPVGRSSATTAGEEDSSSSEEDRGPQMPPDEEEEDEEDE